MRPSVLSAADIAALIAATHSPERPDPYEASPATQPFRDAFWRLPGSEFVARFYLDVAEAPDWHPAFADRLEDYLYENCADDAAAEARLKALEGGAEPTEEEREEFERRYFEFDVYCDVPVYYVFRVTPPGEGDSPEDGIGEGAGGGRGVYFAAEHREMGQHSDMIFAAGPFRSLEEVAEALGEGEGRSPFTKTGGRVPEFDYSSDGKEALALKALFEARAAR